MTLNVDKSRSTFDSSDLAGYQRVLDRIGPQEDEGDLAGLVEELADWKTHRLMATEALRLEL